MSGWWSKSSKHSRLRYLKLINQFEILVNCYHDGKITNFTNHYSLYINVYKSLMVKYAYHKVLFNAHSCLICTPKVGSNAEKLLFRCISHQKMKIFSIEVFEKSLIVWVNNVIKLLKNKIICRSKRKQQKKISFNWIIIVKFFYCCQIKIVKKRTSYFVIIKSYKWSIQNHDQKKWG